MKSDVDLSGGGTIKITPHEAHTGDKAPSNVAGLVQRFLVRNKIIDDKQLRFLEGWSLGHKDADVITLVEDGNVRYNGSWKYSPQGHSVANDHELQSALGKMKNTKPKGSRLSGVRTWNQCQYVSETHIYLPSNNSSLSRTRQHVDKEI